MMVNCCEHIYNKKYFLFGHKQTIYFFNFNDSDSDVINCFVFSLCPLCMLPQLQSKCDLTIILLQICMMINDKPQWSFSDIFCNCVYTINVNNSVTLLPFFCLGRNCCSCSSVRHETELLPLLVFVLSVLSATNVYSLHLFCISIMLYITLPVMSKWWRIKF